MKVKVINKNTNQQFDCEEIEINGFKYYIIDTGIGCKYGISKLNQVVEIKIGYDAALYKGIICSNNPNIDIPKVVDEVEKFIKKTFYKEDGINFKRSTIGADDLINGFKIGYNKSQETHPFSEEDMIEFNDWQTSLIFTDSQLLIDKSTKELLQLWKEQQPKIVYYEKQG